jgi:hypothetical protein
MLSMPSTYTLSAKPKLLTVQVLDPVMQAELQQKTCSLVAVQRNYEVLSKVLQEKNMAFDKVSG